MSVSETSVALDDIDLGDLAFWRWPHDRRDAAFATLRRERPVAGSPSLRSGWSRRDQASGQ